MNINMEGFSIVVQDDLCVKHIVLDGQNPIENISRCTSQQFNGSIAIAERVISVYEKCPLKANSRESALAILIEDCIIANHLLTKNESVHAYVINNRNSALVWNVGEILRLFDDFSHCESINPLMINSVDLISANIVVIDICDINVLSEELINSLYENKGLLVFTANKDSCDIPLFADGKKKYYKKICVCDNNYLVVCDFRNAITDRDICLLDEYRDLVNQIDSMSKEELLKVAHSIQNDIDNALVDNDSDKKNMLIDYREQIINRILAL